MSRIDSIRSVLNTTVPQIYLRLYSPQILPANGMRTAVVFAGQTPDVSPRYGTYVSSFQTNQTRGTSYFDTGDVYGNLRSAGIPSGATGYCWDGNDSTYGAAGYTLLYGPAVPSNGGTAVFFGKKVAGYKNQCLNSSGLSGMIHIPITAALALHIL